MKKLLVLAVAVVAASSQAQVAFTGTYTQNFDSLAFTGTGMTWTNNLPAILMPGWYSNQAVYNADDGSSIPSRQYSYGNNNSTERALGSIALPGAIIQYGLRLNNSTTATINGLSLSYTGEQWRSGSVLTDLLRFEYSTNATSLTSGTWTPFTSLDFNSVNSTGVGAVNGNLLVNQSFQSGTIGSLNWLSGSDMWVRWTHIGNASRHGLAIDKLGVVTAPVPEPLSIAGLGAACIALLRRRRTKA